MFIWGLQFGLGEIICGLKFRGSSCAICGLKSAVGEIILGLIFLVCHCPNHFLVSSSFSETGQLIIFGVFEKLV